MEQCLGFIHMHLNGSYLEWCMNRAFRIFFFFLLCIACTMLLYILYFSVETHYGIERGDLTAFLPSQAYIYMCVCVCVWVDNHIYKKLEWLYRCFQSILF